ncbi:MAG: patatin-like phospholipase family protein [Candidatus Paracaedibacteraceae bacterium]|nr:patatin-like phospholipase family protein [Candidatus Paracaedibacteraceae bacterium]
MMKIILKYKKWLFCSYLFVLTSGMCWSMEEEDEFISQSFSPSPNSSAELLEVKVSDNNKDTKTEQLYFKEDEYGNQYPIAIRDISKRDKKESFEFDPIVRSAQKITLPVLEKKEVKFVSSDSSEGEYVPIYTSKTEEVKGRDYLGLSIDGGGIRGLMPAIWLADLEEKVGDEFGKNLGLSDVFDCIGGTSVGGILALGLAKPIRASELVKIFQTRNNEVFPKDKSCWYVPEFAAGWIATIKNLISRRYDHGPLEELLEEYFGSSQLKDAKTDLFITTCGVDGHPISFGKEGPYSHLKMWEIARCTSAAPTYFEAHTVILGEGEKALVDGGIWANNPSPHVAAHLIKKFQAPVSQVHVLSLGTGEAKASGWIPGKAGELTAIGPIIDALMTSHSKGNHIAMTNLFDTTYCRINSSLPSPITLDNTSVMAIDLLKDLANQELSSLKEFFIKNKEFMRKKLEVTAP